MQRLTSLDILRGIALAGMILVNNPGDWGNIYTPFEHAEFVGLTLADLVFPTFMFVMGMCIPLSLRKFDYRPSKGVVLKILRRTVIIFCVGLFLQWMSSGWCAWHDLRIPGVLQRLALCYGICAMLTLYLKPKHLISLSTLIIISFAFIYLFFDGYEWSENNIVARIDHFLLGANHLYVDNGIRLDPEGIFSTIPSVAHVLLGEFIMFEWIRQQKEADAQEGEADKTMMAWRKFVKYIFNFAIICFLMNVVDTFNVIPIIKKVWSSTFVCVTVSIASILFTALIWIADIKHLTGRWSKFFIIFGRNPLLLYIISWILADWFGHWGVTWHVYQWFCQFCAPCTASLLYAVFFVLVNWLIAFGLYKAKIRVSA